MIEIKFIPKQEWINAFSEKAHLVAFGETKPKEWDRIDFAMLAVHEGTMCGYITCREFDHETLYWQYGGAFPGTKMTSLSFKAYQTFVEASKKSYKRIGTLIENTNTAMLKMAMKVGFRIVGVRMFKGHILLEHLLEFE